MSSYPVLLVGYGLRGRDWHAQLRRRRDVPLVGVVDPDPSARTLAERAAVNAWPSLDAALEGHAAEWALIASPPHEHVPQSLACLQAGLAVLVEKPASLSLDGAGDVCREAQRKGLPVSVAQNFRFLPRERGVRKALGEGFGEALNAVVVSARPGFVAAPHLAQVPHGPLWDICLHHIDALRMRFGGRPDMVEMSVEARSAGSSVGDRYTIQLRWREGPTVLYTHSEGAPAFHHAEWIEGREAAIVVADQRVSVARPGRRPRRVRIPRGRVPEQAVIDEFLATLQGRDGSSLSIQDNLATVAIMHALLEAETRRGPVSLDAVAASAGLDPRTLDA